MPRTRRALLLTTIAVVALVGGAAAPAAASHGTDACSFPVSGTDATGTAVTVDGPPDEVVVLDAASAQTLWEMGADDLVTGMPVRDYTAYLDGSEDRRDVLTGDGSGVDVETVVELDPDLVLAANPDFFAPESIERLRDAGLTVYQYPLEGSVDDIHAKTELYGHLVGECDAAEETAEGTRRDVETVRAAVEGRDEPRVLYYFFEFTAGEDTFVDDLIGTAGGENVAAAAGIDGFQPVSDETVAERDPEWIVTTDDEGALDTSREPLASTTAVRNDRVLVLDADLVSQAAPRVVEPLRAMAEAFHPDAFADGTPASAPADGEPTPTDAGNADGATTPTSTATPTAGGGAGLGVAAGLVALLVTWLLTYRRR